MIRWAQRGLSAEVAGLASLAVGSKASLEWHASHQIKGAKLVEVRVETPVRR